MTIIAIDGPAASGKSSVARRLARSLGFHFINSGSFYRAVTWELLRQGIDPARTTAVESALARMHLECGFSDSMESFVQVDTSIPDVELRLTNVNDAVSAVSAIPAVRHRIVDLLRSTSAPLDVVMEGRDIGTAVFPDAPHKFYLDASPEIRRRRRAAEGQTDSIEQRDRIDSTRAAAPLQVARDATVLDTSHLTLEGVVEELLGLLASRGVHPR
jgi:CMP/dCMP kinase